MAFAATAPAVPRSRTAPAAFVRLGAFFPLALYAAAHWARQLEPAPGFAAFAMVLGATAAGAVLIAARRVRSPAGRAVAVAGVALALAVLAFIAAGVPLRLMLPDAWGDLSAGLGQGLQAMPGVSVPYRGIDGWIRSAIMIGGTLLVGLAALLAFWPSRAADRAEGGRSGFPFAAALALGVLYGVPVVERGPTRPYLDGAVFCLLLATFLWLERLRLDQLGVAGGALGLSVLAGALLAPHLDGSRPWFDYEHFAESLQPAISEQFSWDHTYGPMQWPQDGRELLRVQGRAGTYWKAETLDAFDGYRWLYSGSLPPVEQDTEYAWQHKDWFQTIRVVDRDLKSRQFIGAGTTVSILPPAPHNPVLEAPGLFITGGDPLTRGDSYRARVYTPDPSAIQMRADQAPYPDFAKDYLGIALPQSAGGPGPVNPVTHTGGTGDVNEVYGPYVAGAPADPPELVYPDGSVNQDTGARAVRASAYGRVYSLAQDLRAQSTSAYDFVEAVEERVQQGATYTLTPPPHRVPLVSFLFGDRLGYCQQFSGAMALLLRMGGVPARVATGFTTGSFDHKRNEFVVRDTDAHSWVEVYFPGYGWVKFNPTPVGSARAGAAGGASGATGGARAPHQPGDRPADIHGPGVRPAGGGGGVSPWLIAGLVALCGAALAGVVVLVRRGRLPGAPLAPELAELQRALHRSGRSPAPGVTLAELEQRLGGTQSAAGYVRALRDRRFGGGGQSPSPRQRAALRYELGAGLGIRGRLRAFWALPPRPSEWRWLLTRPV